MISEGIWALGKIQSKQLTEEESGICEEYYGEKITSIPTFKRLQKNGQIFFCKEYTKVKKRNSYTVIYLSGKYGQILYFTWHSGKAAAIVNELLPLPPVFAPAAPIVPVEVITRNVIIDIAEVIEKLVFVKVSNTVAYVVKFPCALDID